MTQTIVDISAVSAPPAPEAFNAAWSLPDPVMVCGVGVHPLTMQQAVERVRESIATRRRLLIAVVNAAKITNMRRDEKLREAVLAADVILADGMSVVWASRILGAGLPERVTGIDLMYEMLRLANEQAYRVFLLGADSSVLDEMAVRVNTLYPGVVIAGARNGYYKPEEEESVARQIQESRADILLVAMSSPKKEEFLGRWAALLGVPILHGVGGAFDVFAGKVSRAPLWMQRFGLEWLHRVLQEPGRMFRRYVVTNSVFAWLVLRSLLLGSAVKETPTDRP